MSKPSWVTIERALRLALGTALIVHEGIIRAAAQPYVLSTGLILLAGPDLVRLDRWLERLRALNREVEQSTKEPAP